MNLEEYVAKKQPLSRRIALLFLRFFRPFLKRRVTETEWLGLLQALFPDVQLTRYEAAELGRQFFDSKREEAFGETIDVYLNPYDFDDFVEAMEPSKEDFLSPDTQLDALTTIANRAVKEVENGGRRTLIRAVESDLEAYGWARYDPRPPTCAFCTMLISRGPVYLSARSAGLKLEDKAASRRLLAGWTPDLDKLMTKYHPGCTCAVIPVFDDESWEGREQFLAAEQLWKDLTKGYKGLDALNALRRGLYSQRDQESTTALPEAV